MLTPAQAAMARSIVLRRLAGRCDVYPAQDVNGVQSWDTIGSSNVRCQVGYPRQGGAQAMMDRLGNEPGVVIWVPIDTEIKSGDHITVQGAGTTYEVMFVPPLRSQDILRGLTCIELRSPGTVT